MKSRIASLKEFIRMFWYWENLEGSPLSEAEGQLIIQEKYLEILELQQKLQETR